MDILVVLEDNNGTIHRMGIESVAAAQHISNTLGLSTGALVMGKNTNSLLSESSEYDLDEGLFVNNELLNEYSSDGYAEAVKQVIDQENPTYVLFGHSYQVRDYVPRVSAKLMRPFLADSISIHVDEKEVSLTKQMFNAKLFTDISPHGDTPFLISFQSASFLSDDAVKGNAKTREVSISLDSSMIKSESEEPFKESSGGVDLSAAELIVSVGRGIGKEENIPMVQDLAEALGAEISSSRPVVDSGWLPPSHQVGSSGQAVSPKMYLALGISGAIQHVVGMKASKNIVVINKDPEAPIFEIADYGVIGDLLEIIPKLTEAIQSK